MSSRPSSRATAGDDNPTAPRSSTTKRPLTKPVAPRLSSTSSISKAPSTSTARASTTASGTLNKPPARPTTATTTTTSSARKPLGTTTGTASTLHRTRPSTTSINASDDETSRDGISAKPKRMSLAASVGTEKATVSSYKSTSATPLRKSVPATTSSTAKPAAKSPTATSKTSASSTLRTSTAVAPRNRPLSMSSSRATSSIADKKRLSTIPASPIVKTTSGHVDDNKENEFESEAENSPRRATAKDRTQLDNTLMEEGAAEELETDGGAADQISQLREELEASQSQVQHLELHIAETQARLEDFGHSVEEESEKVKQATEAIRSEHAAKIEEMLHLHQTQMQEMEAAHQKQMEEVEGKYHNEAEHDEMHIDATDDDDDHDSDSDDGTEVGQLRDQVERLRESENEAREQMAGILGGFRKEIQGLKEKHEVEVKKLKTQIEEAQNGSQPQNSNRERESKANAEKLQEVTAMRTELEGLKKAKAADVEAHAKTVKDLKAQIVAFEKAKIDDAQISDKLQKQLNHEHDDRVNGLQSMLEAAKSELKSVTEAKEREHSEKSLKYAEQLKTAQDQLEVTKNESVTQIKSLQSQLNSKIQEVEALTAAHSLQTKQLGADLDNKNSIAMEDLKRIHAERISRLEAQIKVASDELASQGDLHSKRVQQLEDEVNTKHRQTLKDQSSQHELVVKGFQEQLLAMQNAATSLRDSHDKALMSAEAKYIEDRKEALADLTAEHERQMTNIKSKSISHDTAMESLKSAHAEEIQEYTNKAKSTNSELDAAKFQVQSLKGILQGMEKELQDKEDEHRKEMEKKDHDFSQAVTKLSSQSMRMAELETAHREAVEQAKAAVAAETQASLDALKQQHDEALETLQQALAAEHTATLQTLRSEHSSAIDLLAGEVENRDRSIDHLKAQHARFVEDLKAAAQKDNAEAVDQLTTQHNTAVEELRLKLEAESENRLNQLKRDHASQTTDVTKSHDETLRVTKSNHEKAIAQLQNNLDATLEKLNDTSELDGVTAKLNAAQQTLSDLQKEQAAAVSKSTTDHASQVNKLEKQINTLQEELQKPVDTSEIDNLRKQLEASQAEATELSATHVEAIGKKDIQHADAIKSIEAELDEAKIKINDLSEQYVLAGSEAENQRVAAETAKRELAELKASLSSATSSKHEPTSPTSVDTSKANNIAKLKPKSGLKASKWATSDSDEEDAASSSVTSPTSSVQQQQQQQPAAAEAGNGTSQNSKPTKRNIRGQMAGIQEHIRQMAELNDELLMDNQKWARQLSHVDEDGTANVGVED